MEVTDRGKTSRLNVRNQIEVPLRYKLERDAYVIYAELDIRSIVPGAIFHIEGKSLIDASMVLTGIRCFAFIDKVRQVQIENYGYAPDSFRFYWKPNESRPCENVVAPSDNNRKLVISVLDGLGRKVAEEQILFDVITNGIYREYDGL